MFPISYYKAIIIKYNERPNKHAPSPHTTHTPRARYKGAGHDIPPYRQPSKLEMSEVDRLEPTETSTMIIHNREVNRTDHEYMHKNGAFHKGATMDSRHHPIAEIRFSPGGRRQEWKHHDRAFRKDTMSTAATIFGQSKDWASGVPRRSTPPPLSHPSYVNHPQPRRPCVHRCPPTPKTHAPPPNAAPPAARAAALQPDNPKIYTKAPTGDPQPTELPTCASLEDLHQPVCNRGKGEKGEQTNPDQHPRVGER